MKKENKKIIKFIFLFLILVLIIFASGCQKTGNDKKRTKTQKDLAIEKCKELCLKVKNEINLSQSPCLSDVCKEDWQAYGILDWVCDIAHWPRQKIDDRPENQCQAYRQGEAKHFVELNENCELIRAT